MPPPPVVSPFRLSLTYVHVLREDGDVALANPNTETNAVGIDMAFPSNTLRAQPPGPRAPVGEPERRTARGFRIDLVSLGYPIALVTSSNLRLDLEPILTVVRGEMMFVTNGPRIFRMESGFSLDLSLTVRHWFATVQAFGIDFRYWVYTSDAFAHRVRPDVPAAVRARPRILGPAGRRSRREPVPGRVVLAS